MYFECIFHTLQNSFQSHLHGIIVSTLFGTFLIFLRDRLKIITRHKYAKMRNLITGTHKMHPTIHFTYRPIGLPNSLPAREKNMKLIFNEKQMRQMNLLPYCTDM